MYHYSLVYMMKGPERSWFAVIITDVDVITAVAGTEAITPLVVAAVSSALAFKQVYFSLLNFPLLVKHVSISLFFLYLIFLSEKTTVSTRNTSHTQFWLQASYFHKIRAEKLKKLM